MVDKSCTTARSLMIKCTANGWAMGMNQRQRQAKLKRYRAEQMQIAAERDGGLCQYCLRRLNIEKAGSKPHHVYGHAATWDELNHTHEQYERADKLLTLCYEHHQRCHHVAPLLTDEVIEVLAEVNMEGV